MASSELRSLSSKALRLVKRADQISRIPAFSRVEPATVHMVEMSLFLSDLAARLDAITPYLDGSEE